MLYHKCRFTTVKIDVDQDAKHNIRANATRAHNARHRCTQLRHAKSITAFGVRAFTCKAGTDTMWTHMQLQLSSPLMLVTGISVLGVSPAFTKATVAD